MVYIIIGVIILALIAAKISTAIEFLLMIWFPKAPSESIDDVAMGLTFLVLFGFIVSAAIGESALLKYFLIVIAGTFIGNILRPKDLK